MLCSGRLVGLAARCLFWGYQAELPHCPASFLGLSGRKIGGTVALERAGCRARPHWPIPPIRDDPSLPAQRGTKHTPCTSCREGLSPCASPSHSPDPAGDVLSRNPGQQSPSEPHLGCYKDLQSVQAPRESSRAHTVQVLFPFRASQFSTCFRTSVAPAWQLWQKLRDKNHLLLIQRRMMHRGIFGSGDN